MSVYIHLHVCFDCDVNDGVAQLAAEHLDKLYDWVRKGNYDTRSWSYAEAFLNDLSARTGRNPGGKGGLSLWGVLTGGASPGDFVEILIPFWEDLLSEKVEGGPLNFNHIIVFYEKENTGAANAYEIFWDEPDSAERSLVIRNHERLPFAWVVP